MTVFLLRVTCGFLIGACLASVQSARTSGKSEKACQSLAQSLGPETQSSGAQYNASVKGAWSLFNQFDGDGF